MKKCGTCKTAKAPDEFHRNSKTKDGLTTRCKACAIAAARASYERKKREENPQIDLVREHRARLAEARERGSLYFTPLLACPDGHLSPRYVKTQQCAECLKLRRRSDDKEASRLARKSAEFRRRVAQNNGLKHYQGGPCASGHSGVRLVSTRQCVDCLKARPQSGARKLSESAAARKRSARRSRAGRAAQRRYQRDVLMARPEYRLKRFMYESLRRVLSGAGASKAGRTAEALGFDRQKLMARIECQFKPGMSWGNYGAWHIDHRKPISDFLAQGETRPRVINALCNLQPLWAADNLRKGGHKTQKRSP